MAMRCHRCVCSVCTNYWCCDVLFVVCTAASLKLARTGSSVYVLMKVLQLDEIIRLAYMMDMIVCGMRGEV
jgi:hypothetical protein